MIPAQLDDIIPTMRYFVNRIASPSWCILHDTIDFHDLTYIYKGSATYIINGKSVHASSGNVVYIPKGSTREAYTTQADPMCSFAFNFDICDTQGNDVSLPFPSVFSIGTVSELIEESRHFNRIWIEQSPGYKLASRAIFMQILYRLLTIFYYQNSNLSSDSRIQRIKEYILNHSSEPLETDMLAQMVNLHPVYLGALFKKSTGIPLREYITNIRINSAETLLSIGDCTVGEAAMHCGIDDIYYFSKLFKKFKGYSPSRLLKYGGKPPAE